MTGQDVVANGTGRSFGYQGTIEAVPTTKKSFSRCKIIKMDLVDKI